ncbi:MAG: hypothetical protein KIPDCIKN_04372 [Haliscomenobacter sp.]|nr:hypothetical protein [Haliscomenobacter sp.]
MATRHPASLSGSTVLPDFPDSQGGADILSAHMAPERDRRIKTVRATGSANLALDIGPVTSKALKLVYVRAHFAGGTGNASVTIGIDSANGAAYDSTLDTVTARGTGADLFYKVPPAESADPSPWAIKPGDAYTVRWTNPDAGNMTYGVEAGYVER